jgi:chemotaxis protein MotB
MTSYSKLNVGLIPLGVMVLLSACVSQEKYDALDAQNRQLQAQNAELTRRVARLEGAITYTVNSDLLFKPGSWQVSAPGKKIIAQVASQLAPTQERKLVVNGYTDNQPVGRKLQQAGVTSNRILSQKRAEAVMHYMISRGVRPDLVAAKGWGAAQPIAPNDTQEGRAKNRRVEITIAPGA